MNKILNFNNKWSAIISGLLSSTACGMVLYAFSVLVTPMNEHFGWSHFKITLAFSICCTLSCLSCFPAGILADKIGPKAVTLFGGILTGVGFILSGFINLSGQFYLTYGILTGIGSGFLYLPPLTTVPKWWPDRPFFATGFAVVGLGFGAFFMGPLATWIIASYSWRKVFIWCGFCVLLMGLSSAFLIKNPSNSRVVQNNILINEGFSCKKTIRTTQFWMLYLTFFLGETAGMTVLSQLAPFAIERGYSLMRAAWIVSIFSIANAASRLLSGLLTEKINFEVYFSSILAVQGVSIFLLYITNDVFLFLCGLVFTVGWGFGTMAVLFPSIMIKFFGKAAHSSNYGLLITACAIAGILGPLFASLVKECNGTYLIAFLLSAILSIIASFILFTIKPPIE